MKSHGWTASVFRRADDLCRMTGHAVYTLQVGRTAMALHIRDAEADRLVRDLADRKRIPLTEAIKLAVRNELRREDEKKSLWERLKPLHERVAARPETGLPADKAFYDGLNDE